MIKPKNFGKVQRLLWTSRRMFSHGAPKEYDWRDDPTYNKDLYDDPRFWGKQPEEYTFPYEGKDDWYFPEYPQNFNFSDVSLNIRPDNKKSDKLFNPMTVTYLLRLSLKHVDLRLLIGILKLILLMRRTMNLRILTSREKISNCR